MLKLILASLMLASVSVFAQDFDLGPGNGGGHDGGYDDGYDDGWDRFPDSNQPYTVVCESHDRDSRYCQVDGRIRDVRLRRQLSRADCIQGQTWDFDRNGIYVNRGCRGEFLVFPRRGGGGGGGSLSSRIQCDSKDHRYAECLAEGRIVEVRIERVLSKSACIEGQTWGYDRRAIWVDGGCRAIFRAYYR